MVLKISLIGHKESGKTNFIRRAMGETDVIEPHVERKLEVFILQIGLNNGTSIVAKIYDCGSEPPCVGTREGYHEKSDGAIVMYGAIGPSLSFLELRAWQAVGHNRARPVVHVDQAILEQSGREQLKVPFTKLLRLINNEAGLEVTSFEAI